MPAAGGVVPQGEDLGRKRAKSAGEIEFERCCTFFVFPFAWQRLVVALRMEDKGTHEGRVSPFEDFDEP